MSADRKGFRPAVITVAVMVAVTIVGFSFLWLKSGGTNPVDRSPYLASFRTDDVKNLQPAGDVRMAGVLVGKVVKQKNTGDSATVTLRLDGDVAPLHEGATFRVGLKSIIGQSFVDVVDGDGATIPSNTTLSAKSVIPAVDIDELVSTFDPKTRQALAGGLESLGAVTAGTEKDVSQLMDGVARIGADGYTVVDAVAAQSDDLRELVGDATVILSALDDRRSQITGLVDNAQQVAAATAAQEDDLRGTMTRLPALMQSARAATDELGGLAEDLTPVANDLDRAAPDLDAALQDLPPVTQSLRELLPYMKSALSRAPKTVDQLPTTSKELQAAVPVADELLANVNPMLAYLKPYGKDLGNFLGNFGATFNTPEENGIQPVRLAPIFNEYSLRNIPLDLQTLNPLHWNNNYPAPGAAETPKKWTGTYTDVKKDK
ncbi:MlaD family protein [Aeromicrobium ginsengisoli]|uniref:MCE family protein n=1 Tax=Aeromicrobium ginsengisoli TaxID=363867 RepID=A0A5M4F972_9ACTN|nr:MlaD family protein [Aeromicrobium ginsengisoli]KAA1394243.1 MCE family protein [Aeromicrobium ginsengisoli]